MLDHFNLSKSSSPVIGSLVIAIAYCSRDNERELEKLGVKDSKKLTPKKRAEILEQLKKICKFSHIEITASELTKKMNKMSLNDIEAQAMAKLIKSIRFKVDVMIDLPDRYSWVFRERMEKFKVRKFEAEHKADENYPIVAAASILAKELRERNVAKIKDKTGVDFGSGYPSDPKTRNALKDKESLKKLDKYLRKKWKTLENVFQRKLFE